ncbi:TetR/AcrR family transcriptional regulator [Nocardia huaxiensis]|uniref:TetR family transcriptional regulator n=1 Tax=Nocardia huaxiensis TaxID=2755382 RepID=A0A7D6Z1B2_9NOCA|nr:TetR/AcrR family transcriptional regulator [Nocardia huaxiensis]QLY30066.1 TetR family transcriptional regulator [Nocardia huaxiensis]UFS96331.1 TetR/AcrR family transcriptional regulator [Nocardia huaxiensis]
MPTDDRALPLRERKRIRTRRALADAALRLFTEKGFAATTVEELVDAAEVSRSTFFRAFATKEAVAIEAETELWTGYLDTLAEREFTGSILAALRDVLVDTATELPADWDERYIATRRLVITAPSLLGHLSYARSGVEAQVVEQLSRKLALPDGDLRPRILAETATTAWSIAGRGWVASDGKGGRAELVRRLHESFAAVPEALRLSA